MLWCSQKRQDLDECALCGLPEESLVRGLGVAVVSAAADPGRSGVLPSGPGSHDVSRVASSADGIVSCRLCAWYGLLCACRWVSTACALCEVALLLVRGAVPLWAVTCEGVSSTRHRQKSGPA